MPVTFPLLRPTTRSYSAPEFPTLNPKYVDAVAYPRLIGSKSTKASLSLSYENILDADAALIIAAYMNTLTGFLPVLLPPEVVSGIEDTDLATRIQTGQHLDWYFAGPPKQTSVIRGISSVQVELVGDLP